MRLLRRRAITAECQREGFRDIDNICKTDVGDRVKVNEKTNSGKLKDEYKGPWWLPGKNGHSVTCGECKSVRYVIQRLAAVFFCSITDPEGNLMLTFDFFVNICFLRQLFSSY